MTNAKNASSGGRDKTLPPLFMANWKNTSRLLPSKYSVGEDSVLTRIAGNSAQLLMTAFDLDNATNDRLLAEHQHLPGIGAHELVSAIPFASIINAAFTHAMPTGSRFNDGSRGAWYAARTIRTAQSEVAFHKTIQLAEVGRFEDSSTYDEYLADFHAEFHDLRTSPDRVRYLAPDSYIESQLLAERILAQGSLGVLYPSVRHPGGECVACFRPALVTHVRKHRTYRFTWDGEPGPVIERI